MKGLQETVFGGDQLILDDKAGDDECAMGDDAEANAEFVPQQTKCRLFPGGRTTQKITRGWLEFIPKPETIESFQPGAHKQLVDLLEEALALRGFQIVKSEFAVSPDGMRLFGLLEINEVFNGVRFAIGLRNYYDKSMCSGLIAGYTVAIYDNMMFAGEFKPIWAKHAKGLDLTESVSLTVDRINRGFDSLKRSIEIKRHTTVSDDKARLLIYKAFLEEKFPISLLKEVHRNYFSQEYEGFRGRTLWSLENAFTKAFKELNPLAQFQTTVCFGRFIAPLVDSASAT